MPGMGGSVGVMGGPGGGPTSNPAFQYGQTPSGWTNPGEWRWFV